jgi:integrase
MSIAESIKHSRPTLSDSSIKTYTSVLTSLHKKVFGTGEIHLEDFDDADQIIHFLKSKPPSARKSVLAALVVLTGNSKFREAMMSDVHTFQEDMKKQEASPAQRESAVSPEEIRHIFDRLVAETNLLYSKKQRTVSDLLAISDMVILALLSGIFIPPRRSLDFTAFKINDINADTDNYINKNELVFNTYKTSKTYGRQTVTIPPPLKSILTKYIKINPTPFLFFDSKFKPLTSVTMTQRLNRVFGGRKISINSLRHSYLTSKYTNLSMEQKKMNADMQAMGSSASMLDTYVKLS